jgi:tartrate dehydrogenase/decarboxylase/D-malate dehydrogenase
LVFWDEVFEDVRVQYPDITIDKWHVDALAARFVTRPETLDVVVAFNLFGDILSDLAELSRAVLG